LKKKLIIQIRTFILGVNHGQLLQAKGMHDLIKKVLPNASIKYDLYHNHIAKDIYSQIRKLSLIKTITLLINWIYFCKFSFPSKSRDFTIFGADTIWMYNHPIAPNDLFYFGKDITTGQLISVCPSNAGSAYPSTEELNKLLKKFKFIGVRDEATKLFIKQNNNLDVPILCDSAFFLDKSYLNKIKKFNRKNNLSVYANSCRSIKKEISKNKKVFKVHYLGYFPGFLTSLFKQFSGIYGVLNCIQDSKLLITDTFHGVVMALMTSTPFILIKSKIVLERLDGPLMQCFDNGRIASLKSLNDVLASEFIFDNGDLKSGKLDEFIKYSKDKITKSLRALTNHDEI